MLVAASQEKPDDARAYEKHSHRLEQLRGEVVLADYRVVSAGGKSWLDGDPTAEDISVAPSEIRCLMQRAGSGETGRLRRKPVTLRCGWSVITTRAIHSEVVLLPEARVALVDDTGAPEIEHGWARRAVRDFVAKRVSSSGPAIPLGRSGGWSVCPVPVLAAGGGIAMGGRKLVFVVNTGSRKLNTALARATLRACFERAVGCA